MDGGGSSSGVCNLDDSLSGRTRTWLDSALGEQSQDSNLGTNRPSKNAFAYITCISSSAAGTHFDSAWVLNQMRKIGEYLRYYVCMVTIFKSMCGRYLGHDAVATVGVSRADIFCKLSLYGGRPDLFATTSSAS